MVPIPPLCILTPAGDGAAAAAEAAVALLDAGLGWVQLRVKGGGDAALLAAARRARSALRPGAILTLNDRPDVAKLAGIPSVHLGDRDLPPEPTRRLLGRDAWIGISTHSPEEALRAGEEPVDYVALGPIWESPTKRGVRSPLGAEAIREAKRRLRLPLVVIGGVSRGRLAEAFDAGADAVALVSEVWDAADPIRMAREARGRGRPTSRPRPEALVSAPRRVFLVGFMGAGKTSAGRRVADRLGYPFVDVDEIVEAATGLSVREIFEKDGEAEFRRREASVLETCTRLDRAVVATGGGPSRSTRTGRSSRPRGCRSSSRSRSRFSSPG